MGHLKYAIVVLLLGGIVIVVAPSASSSSSFAPRRTAVVSAPRARPGVEATVRPAASVIPNSSVATRRPDLGVFEDVEYLTGQALTARLDAYQALHIRYMRFQLEWSNVSVLGRDRPDQWGPDDAVIRGLLARHIEPVVVIDDTPAWARPADCRQSPSCAPADPHQFAEFAAAAVRRYRGLGVHYWEIWNEPNNPVFWRPRPSVPAYTALLRDSYVAIRAADPRAVVLTGGTAPETVVAGGSGIPPIRFLAGIYAHGGKGYFDGVAVHPYVYPELPGTRDPASAWYQMYGTATSIRGLMVRHGDGDKLIWGTEFGAPDDPGQLGGAHAASQTQTFDVGYRLWKSYPWTGPLIWYSFQDTGTDTSDLGQWFGLRTFHGLPRPVYHAFLAAAEHQP